MIDPRGAAAFVHNPKTAGTSIAAALQRVGWERMWDERSPSRWLPPHAPRKEIVNPDIFVFGVARNPWDRLASYYAFACDPPRRAEQPDAARAREAGFKRWLLEWIDFISEEDECRGATVPVQRRPQSWWLDGCDVVCRYERLAEDYAAVCARLGIDDHLDWFNARRRPHYREWYDDEARAAVAEWHAEDVERWGYEF